MASNAHIKGAGMLYVLARISRPDIMDYDIYMKWYDDDHIAEIIETSGVDSAYRYVNIDKTAKMPYLAFYPMADMAFTQGEEFRKIRVKSDLLPGTGLCYDLAENDVRYIGLIGTSGMRKGVAEYLLVTSIEPSDTTSDADASKWLETVQGVVSKIPGYLRTTRYRLLYARSNAQSRALKGLPTTDEPAPEPPTWQAIHEFEQAVDSSVADTVRNEKSCKQLLDNAKQLEVAIYKLAKAHGKKEWFDT